MRPQDAFGITAMYEAVRMGNSEVIDVLQRYDAKLGMDEDMTAGILTEAVIAGDLQQLRALLKIGAWRCKHHCVCASSSPTAPFWNLSYLTRSCTQSMHMHGQDLEFTIINWEDCYENALASSSADRTP
eukprot:1157179-Pelagomonas_calceolata.AAC.2